MKKKLLSILLTAALLLLLCSCSKDGSLSSILPSAGNDETASVPEQTEEPTVPATTPEDGDPGDVTCKGSYTAEGNAQATVAAVEDSTLTNEALAVWYWAAVGQYREARNETAPDFTKPLDTQPCPVDSSVRSWQQYFLKQALDAWHTSRALMLQAQTEPLIYEEAYQPNEDTHANAMTGMPATKVLYGQHEYYVHNSMHQSYLDGIPQTMEQLAADAGYADAQTMAQTAFAASAQELTQAATQYNEAYMYLTFLGYDFAPTPEEIEAHYTQNQQAYEAAGITRESGNLVNIRHILLIPEGNTPEQVEACLLKAQELLTYWKDKTRETEGNFAELAYRNSMDTDTYLTGGKYIGLAKGQLCPELDAWAFDAARQPGDTEILQSELGIHIVYFSGSVPIWQAEAGKDAEAQLYLDQITKAKEAFPMKVTYSNICLPQAEGTISFSQLLYPDIAHERYPEAPLYLQQDYPRTFFGGYPIRTHGCGITTFSMLNSYMTDEEQTPPEMCEKYYSYGSRYGTDGMIFINETPNYDYFCVGRVFDDQVARQALIDGYIVISLQHKGYWTRGGHYLLLEKQREDGLVQVRDSNIANYARIEQHAEDGHAWSSFVGSADGFWIFEPKQTRTSACERCGTPDNCTQTMLTSSYLCPKCSNALIRRDAYLFG